MRIDVTQGIRDYEGNLIETPKLDAKGGAILDETKRPVMVPEQLRKYFINALNSQQPGEVLVAEDKAQIYYLSKKLYASKEVNLTKSDRDFILDRVGKIYNPLIYGRVRDLFDKDYKADVQVNPDTATSVDKEGVQHKQHGKTPEETN